MAGMGRLAHGELVVTETDDDWFLGTAEVLELGMVVRNGFAGRPVTLDHDDVVRVTPHVDFTHPG
jgi:hypothetical protein